jgi:hypothetical protein
VNNPYVQVALTYLRRPFSSLLVLLRSVMFLALAAFFLWISSSLPMPEKAGGTFYFGFVLIGLFLYIGSAIHIREQFDNHRASLFPSFMRPHLTIAGIVVTLSTIFLLKILVFRIGLFSIGPAAVLVVWFSLIFWSVLNLSAATIMASIGLCIVFIYRGDSLLGILSSGKNESLAIGLLILGLAAIAMSVRRLVRINEDMPEGNSRIPMAWAGQNHAIANDQPGANSFSERLKAHNIAILVHHVQCARASSWSRIRRWQEGKPSGQMQLLLFFLLLLLFITMHYVLFSTSSMLPLFTNIIFFLPVLANAQLLYGLKQKFRFEMLLPVERNSYLKQKGLAIAESQFRIWFILASAAFLCQLIMAPQSIVLLLALLAHSLFWQIGIFGVGIWFLRFRSWVWPVMALTAIVNFGMSFFRENPSTLFLLSSWYTSIGIALLSLLMTWHAYRRWLVTEI